MTIHFPDLSQYTPINITMDIPCVIARATLSDRVFDSQYRIFKTQCTALAIPFAAYHWLNHGNITNQVSHCISVVGGAVPLMIDAEDMVGNTGFAGALTVNDINDFASQYRARGGIVHLVYLPRWYWQDHMHSPDLKPLSANGLHLVSSNYRTYSDTGAGWDAYGGMTPVQWQYTSTPLDMNAFKGTVSQWWELVSGGIAMSDADIPDTHRLAYNGDTWSRAAITGENPAKYKSGVGWPGSDATTPNELHNKLDRLKTLIEGQGGLSAEDRALIQGLTDAVTALNNRLASP